MFLGHGSIVPHDVSQEWWTRSAKCWHAAGLDAYAGVPGMKF